MKINGYILANRTQEVPIPVPGEEVTTGISWTYSNPTVYASIWNADARPQPLDWWYPTETVTDRFPNGDQYEESYPGILPAKMSWIGYRLEGEEYEPGRNLGVWEGRLTNVKGSFTISGLESLTPGKYVIVCDHWYGSRDSLKWSDDTESTHNEVQNLIATKTIKQGTHGVVYGETDGQIVYFDPSPTPGYGYGILHGIHIVQRCAFTVGQGDTSKTFTYGDDSFGLSNFGEVCAWWYNPGGNNQRTSHTRYSETIGLRPRLYKEV